MKPCSRSVFAVQPQCDAMNLPCACDGSAVLMQHFARSGCWQLAIRPLLSCCFLPQVLHARKRIAPTIQSMLSGT